MLILGEGRCYVSAYPTAQMVYAARGSAMLMATDSEARPVKPPVHDQHVKSGSDSQSFLIRNRNACFQKLGARFW